MQSSSSEKLTHHELNRQIIARQIQEFVTKGGKIEQLQSPNDTTKIMGKVWHTDNTSSY
mgnify:CR=1 FL=1